MNLLIIGDISGEDGKRAIKSLLPEIKKKYTIDLVIANIENVTNGRGCSISDYMYLITNGVDYCTLGNHAWKQSDYASLFNKENVIRPLNVICDKGSGSRVFKWKDKTFCLTNLIGSTIQIPNIKITNAFIAFNKICEKYDANTIHLVDFHAETTAEKNCFFLAFCNKVRLIYGTHTHIQTNDCKIKNGCGFITDVGMTGYSDGVIGARSESIMQMFFGKRKNFVLTCGEGKYQFNAIVVKINQANQCESIIQLNILEKN